MWRLDGIAFDTGEILGQLSTSIADAPAIDLDDGAVTATDDLGPVPLAAGVDEVPGGPPVRHWRTARPTVGPVEVSYLAEPVSEEPRPTTPPLELRREGPGLSGALKCFLVLPPRPDDLTFEVHWKPPSGDDPGDGWMAVSSLGEGLGRDGDLVGAGLELLGDSYVMCGPLAGCHHREGDMSTWWLTTPALDVGAFTTQLGTTHRLMTEAFDAPAHAYRVFLRASPHHGANASAHPASFVMTTNPAAPLDLKRLCSTIAHELVHEWLQLDGPAEEITWFVEGAADYYSLVLPLRAGLIDDATFLGEVNNAARLGYASPLRHLSLEQASRLDRSDFRAHKLPYVRGMFYLADLDARLKEATSGRTSVDAVVRHLIKARRAGTHVGLDDWCASVAQLLGHDERPVLDHLVFTGIGRPGPGPFAPTFELEDVAVPVLDLGFDVSTFVTRRVQGVVPGGPADAAGLADGDAVTLPSYPEAIALGSDDTLDITVTRDGEARHVAIPLGRQTTRVPQWRIRDTNQ
ncbi:MAG: M61 family metallopeptidase [Nocardioidaceae bacterium]